MAVVRNIIVRIGADLSNLQTSLNRASSQLRNFGSAMTGVGAPLTAGLTLPILGIGAASIKAAADFEQGMSNIKAVSGATGDEMKQLQALALKMGADTKYSAKEAASGIEELIKAGVSTEQILKGGLEGALSLAAAGELELADAAEIASTALNAFRKDNLTVKQAADILAGGANASATSVQEMKFSLAACAAVASSVGMTFKDTSTAIAVFAQNGLKGSDAGTSLKTMLMNLQPATDKQIKLFKKLGLTTKQGTSDFYDQNGKLKSLDQIAGLLRKSMGKMTDAQRLMAMETLFGSDAIRAANILYAEGAEGVKKMSKDMSKVTAAQVAAEKMNNLNGSIEQLKGSLETLGIQLGQIFLPYLKKAADYLTVLTNSFMTLSPGMQKTIIIIAGIAAAIGPLLLIIGGLASGLGAVSAMGAAIAGAFVPVILPIIAVAAVIGVLVAAFMHLWNTNAEFRKNMTELWNRIQRHLIVIWENIKIAAIAIWDGLKAFWDEWGGTIMATLKWIFEAVGKIVEGNLIQIKGIIKVITGIITGDWDRAWWGIKDIVFGTFSAILGMFNISAQEVLDTWTKMWNDLTNSVNNGINGIIGFFTGLYNGATSIFTNLWNSLTTTVSNIVNGITAFFEALPGNISNILNNVAQYFTALPGKIMTALSNLFLVQIPYMIGYGLGLAVKITAITVFSIVYFFQTLPARMAAIWTTIVNAVTNAWNNVYTTITTVVPQIINSIVVFFQSLPGKIAAIWASIVNSVTTTWNNVYTQVTTTVPIIINTIVTFFQSLPGKILAFFTQIINNFKSWGTSSAAQAKQGANNIVSSITNTISKLPGKMEQFGRDVINGLVRGIKNFIGSATNAAVSIASNMTRGFKDALGIKSPSKVFMGYGIAITEGLKKGIKKDKSGVKQAIDDIISSLMQNSKKLLDFGGLFDKTTMQKFAGEDFIRGMKSQINVMEVWKKALENLAARLGTKSALFQNLLQLGPEYAGQLKAMAGMSDAKLKQYQALYNKKSDIALSMGGALAAGDIYKQRTTNGITLNITGNNISNDYDVDRIMDRAIKKMKAAGVY